MNTKILIIILSALLMSSCLEDEGNYDYKEINAPVFTFTPNPYALGYSGSNMKREADFYFPQADSLELYEKSSYEWKLKGVVISTQRNLDIPTDEVYEKLGLTQYPAGYMDGTFAVVDSETGVKYLQRITYYIRPKFWKESWLILSEDGENSKLSYLRRFYERDAQNAKVWFNEPYPNIFRDQNDGRIIQGKPIKIIDHTAKHICPSVGATTILTTKEALEIGNEDFKVGCVLNDEFLDGPPNYQYAKDVFYPYYYNCKYNYIISDEGKIYIRKLTENNLGGKFINTPYAIDDKDTKIEFFSTGMQTADSKYLYDSNNHRLLCLDKKNKIRTIPKAEGEHLIDITNMGENTEVLALADKMESPQGNVSWSDDFTVMIFNENNETYLGEFVMNTNPDISLSHKYARKIKFPYNLTSENKIWFPDIGAYGVGPKYKYAVFFVMDKELRYYDRELQQDFPIISFDKKISAIHYSSYYSSNKYKFIAVGFEDGEFFLVDMSKETPEIFEDSRMNVGGKIVDLSQIGSRNLQ